MKNKLLSIVLGVAVLCMLILPMSPVLYEQPANAAIMSVAETDTFYILSPSGLSHKPVFATSDTDEYLSSPTALMFRLKAKAPRVFSDVSYTDGDTGGYIDAAVLDDYFLIKLRFNEEYTFRLTQTSPTTEIIEVVVDFSGNRIFDLTAPAINFSLTNYADDGSITFYAVDTVASKSHINQRSGIKRVTVTAANLESPVFEKSDYAEGLDNVSFTLQDVDEANGDYSAEIVDYAGHTSVVGILVWGNSSRDNATSVLESAAEVTAKTIDGVGLSNILLDKLEGYTLTVSEMLNDWEHVNLNVFNATVQKLTATVFEANAAFGNNASVDSILSVRVENLHGSISLSTIKARDYYPQAKFGDTIEVVISVKESAMADISNTKALGILQSYGKADIATEYTVTLTVNGVAQEPANAFYVTLSKKAAYQDPILVVETASEAEVKDSQSDLGWIRFAVAGNGVYTVFFQVADTGIPWWGYLLIAIGSTAILGGAIAFIVVKRKSIINREKSK